MATEAPVKVSAATRERARLVAAMLGLTQGQVLDQALAEFVENHKEEMDKRLVAARKAITGGDEALLAFVTGSSAENIRTLGGVRRSGRS